MDAFSLIDEEEKKRKKRLISSVDEGNLLISDKKKSDDILNFAYSYKPPQAKREEVVAPQSQTSKQQSSIFQQIGGVLSRVWDGLKTGATQIVKTEKPQEVFSSFTKYQQDTIKKIQVNQKDKAEFYALSSAPVIFKRINEIDNKIKNEVVSDKKGFISNSIYKSLTEEKNKLNDLVNRGITDERAAYEMFKEAQNILKKRYQTGIAIGLTEAAKSTFIDSISWLAKDTPFISDKTQAASKKVDEWVNAVRPENSNFADSLSSGVGSALFFYIPGFGIAKGTSFLARVSPKLALFFGGSASAALEATAEAGSVYQENINAKKTKQESSKEADKTFYANLFLVGITNRFGMFSDKLKGLKRILISAPIEGLQEGFQQVIGNVNTGKDYMEGVLESGVIGTIIGAGLGSIDIVEDVKVKDKEVAKPVKVDKEDTVPPVVKEAIEKVTDSKKEVSPLNVQGLDELTNKKIEELNTKDAENPIQEGYVRVYQAVEKGKETSYVFKTPQELAQYKNNTTSETEQFQYKDVKPEQLEAVEAKPGVFQIKEEKKKTSTLSATPADQLANSEASNLTREEFINKGIEEYKKSEEYLNASEDNKQWFISTERNLLAEHFTNVQRIKGESVKEEVKKDNKENEDILTQEINKYKSAKEFYLRMDQNVRDILRSKGIRGEEALTDYWNKNAKKTEPILDTLNPTGTILAEYDPQSRMTMKLGKNITTYDKTAGLKPDDIVTIYRGASKKYSKINPGDYITTKREVAESYTGDKNVIEMQVKAEDILDDITEPLGDEYIYRPKLKEVTDKNIQLEKNIVKESEQKQKEVVPVEKKEGPLKEFVEDKDLSRLAEYTSNKYLNIKDLESRPGLLYGGVSRNIFTDGFTMILDKKAAKKINDMALEKAEKRYVAKIKREIIKRDGKDPSKAELESMGKKYTKEKIEEYTAENKFPAVEKVIDGVNKVISEYKEADPMGYVPIGDDAVGVVFNGPQGNIVINGRFYRTLQEMFPKAKLYVYEKLRPAILKQGDVVKAVIMPINIAPETQALIKGRLGEQKGGSVGEQKSIYQKEFSGKKVDVVQGIQFPEMVRIVKEITGMTPKVKKKLGNALGKFFGRSGEIKLRADIFENTNDAAQVLAHEIGHLFDWMPDKTLKRGNLLGRIHSLNKFLKQTFGTSEIKNKEIRQELINLGIEWNPFTPGEDPTYTKYRLSPAELYADSISVLLNDPALLKEKAPKFWDLFFENLDKKPQVKQALFDTYDLLNKGEQAVLSQREEDIRSMFKKGEDGYAVKRAESQKRKTDYLFRLKYDFIDKNQKVLDKVNKDINEGKYIADEDNPKYWLEEQNYIGSVVKSWIEDKIAPIYTMFNENNISWEDFGEALFLDRVINERGKIANPLGFAPDTAQKQLDFLKKNMGEKKAEVLTKALKQFREGVNMWLSKASDAGVYSSEIVSQLKANPSYATFQVIDYLDQYIPASIKKSVGTLKEIANPADATILKTIGLIRAIEKNTAKTKTVSFLKQSYSNEIMPAKTIWNGKTHIPVDPKEEGLALFTVLENGKLKGYYVDEYIAKAYEYGGSTTTNVALNILKFLNRGFYKPLFTTFNLGFQSFNAVRDFMRFYKNIPDMSLWRAFIRYGQAVRPAFERSFTGVSNETIKEMERLKILGVTYNDIINERTNEDKQIEYMLQKYDILSKKEKTKLYKWPLKILDLIEKTGNFIEILPKVAGYKELNGKMPTKEMASFIRTSVGSPDFFRKGASYSWYNEVFLFANAIKEGIRADVSIATNPKTRGAFWMKTATVTFAPKILMFAALAGLFGDEMKKMFEKMSEYDKTNYTIVPMGTDQNGRVVYLRIPQDETGRFLGGLLWKSMRITNNDQSALKNMTDLFSFGAGQFPNLSPTINLIMGTAQFLAGQNPYDFFRGRNVIPDNEFKAGGKYALKPFALWMFQTLGGGVFLNTYITEQTPATKTWTQKVVELPVLSNIVGRWIKVSDYGTVEQARKLSETTEQKAAEQRIIKREAIKDAVKEFVSGKDKSAYKKTQVERGLVIEILGYKPKSGDTSGKAKERDIIKRFRIGVLQNKYDPYVDQLLYATSNDEKILYLKKIKETSSEYQFMKLKQELIKEKVISKEVLKKIK